MNGDGYETLTSELRLGVVEFPNSTPDRVVAGDHQLNDLDSVQEIGDWRFPGYAPPVEVFPRRIHGQSTGLAHSGPAFTSSAATRAHLKNQSSRMIASLIAEASAFTRRSRLYRHKPSIRAVGGVPCMMKRTVTRMAATMP